eukprot:364547-Chlamydomonas_euryale.AAC.5
MQPAWPVACSGLACSMAAVSRPAAQGRRLRAKRAQTSWPAMRKGCGRRGRPAAGGPPAPRQHVCQTAWMCLMAAAAGRASLSMRATSWWP